MRKILVGVILGLPLLFLASRVLAGARFGELVSVNTTSRFASGSLASARGSTDSVQFIGCGGNWASTGTFSGTCFAKDATGVAATCTFTSTTLAQALTAVQGDTRVQFQWDTSNHCTTIALENASYWAPKQP